MKIKTYSYLYYAKNGFFPAYGERFSMLVWIVKPYEIDSADVASMVTMTNPLQQNIDEKMQFCMQQCKHYITLLTSFQL